MRASYSRLRAHLSLPYYIELIHECQFKGDLFTIHVKSWVSSTIYLYLINNFFRSPTKSTLARTDKDLLGVKRRNVWYINIKWNWIVWNACRLYISFLFKWQTHVTNMTVIYWELIIYCLFIIHNFKEVFIRFNTI